MATHGWFCLLWLVAAAKPHVLFVLVDDLGWANVGFNRDAPVPKSVVTPNLDRLATEGIRLKRHYVHKMCTPTRTSVQSGRLPVHVNTGLGDVCDDNTGIPYNMTGLAEKMKLAGYKTHFAGKWDAGMATPRHSPHGRGYDTSLNYFSHKNDFYSQSNMQTCCESDQTIIDFWRTNAGASDVNGTAYSEFLYQNEMLGIIEGHNPKDPLFLFYAPHVAHCPLQVPKEYYDKFDFMDDEGLCSRQTVKDEHPIDPLHPELKYRCRRQHAAMIMLMDEVVGNLTNALRKKGMWNDTLMIFSSDNGGPVRLAENAANNWPLRGGKYSNFEGGVRVAAFLSGGMVPVKLRGSSNEGIIHIADWYATLCHLVGVDPFDARAADAGLPPIDSLNLWPMLMGAPGALERQVVPLGPDALIWGRWKLLTAGQAPSFWQGPTFPNSSSQEETATACAAGCLFDVVSDSTEQRNLWDEEPQMVSELRKRLEMESQTFFENRDSFPSSCPADAQQHCACWMAKHRYKGFLGPYALLDQPIPADRNVQMDVFA